MLKWTPEVFGKAEPRDIILAMRAYNNERRENWEMVRTISFFSMVAMNGNKVNYSDIKLPIDKQEKVKRKFTKIIKHDKNGRK